MIIIKIYQAFFVEVRYVLIIIKAKLFQVNQRRIKVIAV